MPLIDSRMPRRRVRPGGRRDSGKEFDLHVAERVEVGKRLWIERLSSGLASSSWVWPVMARSIATVSLCSFGDAEDRLAQAAS